MQQKQLERWEGVDNYVVDQTIMGTRTPMYYERITVAGADGARIASYRVVTPKEVTQRQARPRNNRPMTADE